MSVSGSCPCGCGPGSCQEEAGRQGEGCSPLFWTFDRPRVGEGDQWPCATLGTVLELEHAGNSRESVARCCCTKRATVLSVLCPLPTAHIFTADI